MPAAGVLFHQIDQLLQCAWHIFHTVLVRIQKQDFTLPDESKLSSIDARLEQHILANKTLSLNCI